MKNKEPMTAYKIDGIVKVTKVCNGRTIQEAIKKFKKSHPAAITAIDDRLVDEMCQLCGIPLYSDSAQVVTYDGVHLCGPCFLEMNRKNIFALKTLLDSGMKPHEILHMKCDEPKTLKEQAKETCCEVLTAAKIHNLGVARSRKKDGRPEYPDKNERCDWKVQCYGKKDKKLESWIIKDRTENEASNEAEADISRMPYVIDWTMMPEKKV